MKPISIWHGNLHHCVLFSPTCVQLCLKYPLKHRVLVGFLATFLREEGGFEFKKAITDCIVELITAIPETKVGLDRFDSTGKAAQACFKPLHRSPLFCNNRFRELLELTIHAISASFNLWSIIQSVCGLPRKNFRGKSFNSYKFATAVPKFNLGVDVSRFCSISTVLFDAMQEMSLFHLCDFIEDCEFTALSTQILSLVGELGPSTSAPARYIRFIYNRYY